MKSDFLKVEQVVLTTRSVWGWKVMDSYLKKIPELFEGGGGRGGGGAGTVPYFLP